MASKSNLSVVIDMGTSKLVAAAGYKTDTNKLVVAGITRTPSSGLKRGIIYNIEEAASAVSKILTDLERQVGEGFDEINVAIAGQHLKTVNYHGTKLTSDEGIVTQFDVDHLYNEAWKAEIETGYKIIEVIPTTFIIDEDPIETNPTGSTGKKIEAHYKLVIIPEVYVLNLQRVIDKAGYKLGEIKHAALAVSEAVITEDEKEMGVIVLDIGAGTTKLAVYYENRLMHAAVIPFGGEVVTRDIKEGCSVLLKWAEQLKTQYGEALGDFADDQKVVTIPGHNGWEPKEISFKSLAFIIQARLEEIMDFTNAQISKSGIEDLLGAGIVLTGGTANVGNIISLVKFRTGMDARLGNLVIHLNEKRKEYIQQENFTALGLLKMIVERTETMVREIPRKNKKKRENGGFSPIFQKVVQGVLNYIDDDNEDISMNN
ncbi:MAG: cell division protein FtsA [Prolixibacteraceae bacterium]|nr:cell division protein FtsA [Prolixibacteraceae bacterium]